MGRRKISTTVYLTAEQDAELKQLSAASKVPVAEYVREGIDRVLRSARQMGLLGGPKVIDET